MTAAAKIESHFSQPPHRVITQNSPPAHQLPTAVLYQGFGVANSNTTTSIAACLYDSGRRSRFTSKERDAETGLDYFEARYMSSVQGRFMSPDPLVWQTWSNGPPDARAAFQEWIRDPQNLNLYSYVRNNPLKYTDPHGLTYQICDANGNCSNEKLSDADFEDEKKKAKAAGEYFSGGNLYHYDSGGKKVNDGTYRQTDVDLNSNAQSLFTDHQELWRNSAGAVNTAATATGVLVAAPMAAEAVLSLSTMQVAVGPGVPYGIHVAYEANGTWLHGIRNIFGNIEVTADAAAAYASRTAWFKLTLPVANPGAVAGTEGSAAKNCLSAACGAFLKGWWF